MQRIEGESLHSKSVGWASLSKLARLDFHIVTSAVLIASLFAVIPALSAADVSAIAKIAPRLASETSLGGSSEALIVFAEQADLSGAANLGTRLEKGLYVYNALRTVADRTQAPMRKLLEARGIPYQSFYGVNMIKLTASRDLLYELAARNEVLQIDANRSEEH